MISCNNNNYILKCYLKFFKIVLDRIGSVEVSYANINFGCGVLKYKKNFTCFRSQTLELTHKVCL